jgi:predicted Rossmann fold flavoprotein
LLGSLLDVTVIGAGAAGLMAALTAAERNLSTLLLEKNRQPGVKILMSGGTRCNLTQNTNNRGIIEAYGDQGRFLHSALAILSPQELVQFIEAEGVPTKIEETNKIFPVSNRASDIVDALVARVQRSGATLQLNSPVQSLHCEADVWQIVTTQRTFHSRNVIVTTGGLSYPGSGTTGDGFAWAQSLGHTLIPTRPALTPLTTNEDWVRTLSGLTLPDILVKVTAAAAEAAPFPAAALRTGKQAKQGIAAQQRGSVLFTHFGLSGPAILDVSRAVTTHPVPNALLLLVDFLPDINATQLDQQLREECASDGKKQVVNVLARWVPRRLAEALCQQLQLPPELRSAELNKRDRQRVLQSLKQTSISLSGALGYKKAEVTAGGVSLAEVDSRTMQSKLQRGLYFAGEVLDLDGPIGGYNFQAAFATGRLAGLSVQ